MGQPGPFSSQSILAHFFAGLNGPKPKKIGPTQPFYGLNGLGPTSNEQDVSVRTPSNDAE